jgi:hypothetical protein
MNRIGILLAVLCASLLVCSAQEKRAVPPPWMKFDQRFSPLAGTLKARAQNVKTPLSPAAAGSSASSQLFLAAPQFLSGQGQVGVGDFNGDGKLDLLTLAGVLLNNGDGTFRQPVGYLTTAWTPTGVAVDDFNGDGKLDIAVSAFGVFGNFSSPEVVAKIGSVVSILLGNGDGTFQPRMDFPEPYSGGGLAVGDFNGDGKRDLAVTGGGLFPIAPPFLSILLGNGDGTFRPHVDTTQTNIFSNSVAVGDFDGDAKTDVALPNSNTVAVFLSRGDGTFQKEVDYVAGAPVVSVGIGDFNGDHKLDLAVATYDGTSSKVDVLLGNGDGTFQEHLDYDAAPNSGSIAIQDLNGDGKADVALTTSAAIVSVLFGNGDGTLGPHVDYGVGVAHPSLFVGDFNGDGKPDLATGTNVLLNNGDGTFRSNREYLTGRGPVATVTADVNGDGIPDMATANGACIPDDDCRPSQTVSVLLGNSDGTLRPATDYPTGNYPQSLAVGDFNGDGRLDLVTANHDDDTVSVLMGNGDGTFRPRVDYLTATFPYSVAVGDFNGDGKLDLAVATVGNSVVSVLLGNGDGTFRAHLDYPTALPCVSVAVGDFNGDGRLDLVATGPNDPFATSSGQLSVLLGNGDGTFQAHKDYAVGRALKVTVADLNADGKKDLVVANGGLFCRVLPFGDISCSNNKTIIVLLGNGDGTFRAAVNYETGAGPFSVAIGDFNGDGKRDVVVANSGATTVSVLWGNGDGTFRPHLDIEVGLVPSSVAVKDMNGDLKDDLAVALAASIVALTASSRATVLLNTQTAPENIVSVNFKYTGFFGVVLSSPAGINCGSSCTASYEPSSAVSLAAEGRDIGSVFTDWSGDCVGAGPCILDMSLDRSVTATFANNPNPTMFTLTVNVTGSGTGHVGSENGVLQCVGNTCSGSYFSGTTIHIGAVADPGSTFDGWKDAGCTQAQMECVVTMNSDVTLTAGFSLSPRFNFTVSLAGNGTGTVTSNPSGINCVPTCTAGFVGGTQITLTAAPDNLIGNSFGGWSGGGCSGTGTCVVMLTSTQDVTATFTEIPDFNLSFASPQPNPVVAGQSASATSSLQTGRLNFTVPINFTCTVQPSPPLAPQCSLSPTSITPPGGFASPGGPTLTVTTTPPPNASMASPSLGRRSILFAMLLPLTGFVCMGFGLAAKCSRRKQFFGVWLASVAFLAIALQIACGGQGSGGRGGGGGTPPGTYTISVTGTSGVTHATAVTLNVQ